MAGTTSSSRTRGETVAFRAVAYIEAVTYLALLGGVIVYRVFDGPFLSGVLGPVHGIAFLVYVILVLVIRESQRWGFWRTVLVIVLAAVPFGGFWAGSHLREVQPAASRRT